MDMVTSMISRRIKYIGLATITMACAYFLVLFCERIQYPSLWNRSAAIDDTRQKIVVIMTQTRSGSTFTGEIFAATNNSMYLYEPLYPYGLDCRFPLEREALLKQLLNCDFMGLRETYSSGLNKSNMKNDAADCVRIGLCFAPQTGRLLESYRKSCRNTPPEVKGGPKKCGYPLSPELLRNMCESSTLLLTKVNRICTLEEMDNVYRHLRAGKKDVYVLHMLRDVRSIASSHVKLYGKEKLKYVVGSTIKTRCTRQRQNVIYKVKAPQEYAMIADGRYMRIRYEDLATNATDAAKNVFQFMGRSLPPEVVNNIKTYLHPNMSVMQKLEVDENIKNKTDKLSRQYKSPYGVVRDPTKILNEWRNLIPFGYVRQIQTECGDVLKEMGYNTFSSEVELKDLSRPSFRTLLR